MATESLAQPAHPSTRPTTRFERGVALLSESRIADLGEGMYKVWGSRPVPYLVDFEAGVCSCPDWQRHHEDAGPCKHLHLLALRLRRQRKPRASRRSIARVLKLDADESLRGVLCDPEALDRVAERLGV